MVDIKLEINSLKQKVEMAELRARLIEARNRIREASEIEKKAVKSKTKSKG